MPGGRIISKGRWVLVTALVLVGCVPACGGDLDNAVVLGPGQTSALLAVPAFEHGPWFTIEFSYQFMTNADAELVVQVSHDPQGKDQTTEMVRVRPPRTGRAGAPGSEGLAVFRGRVSLPDYDAGETLYILLELRGLDSQCRIVLADQWSRAASCELDDGGAFAELEGPCGFICGDFTYDNAVTEADYLTLVAHSGQPVPVNGPCLDLGGDGFVDLLDILTLDLAFHQLNVCASGGGDYFDGSINYLPAEQRAAQDALMVCGKSDGPGAQDDRLYVMDVNGVCHGSAFVPPLMTPEESPRGYSRLVWDGRGRLCQVHAAHGLIDLRSAEVIVPGLVSTFQGRQVQVGIVSDQGVSLKDAVFHPQDANVVYVVPVQVWSPVSQCPYRAAAKLILDANQPCQIAQIYGQDPAEDPQVTVTHYGCGTVLLEPDVQQLREIEVDPWGTLFVISSQQVNDNDWVLIYDEKQGNASEVRILASDVVEGPTSALVSAAGDYLYLTSSVESAPGSNPRIVRFAIERTENRVTGLVYESQTAIINPGGVDLGFGTYTMATAIVEAPREGTLYVTGYTAPRFDGSHLFGNRDPLFTIPFLGVLSPGMPATVPAREIQGADMALPLAAVWIDAGF